MKVTSLATVLVCFSAMCAPALALDISLGASIGAGASVSVGGDDGLSLGLGANAAADTALGLSGLDSPAGTDTEVVAEATDDTTFNSEDELGRVIALIDASAWTETTLSGVTDIEATAYDVTGWINAENQAAFDLALSANAEEIDDLQAAFAANASLESWLEANNATAADVIAVGVAADGSLAVFTN